MLRFLAMLAMLLLAMPATASPFAVPTVPADEAAALNAAVVAMCGKQVALLGEATHAGGHTDAFKVALVYRLVTQCHFTALAFEASQYEFVEIGRRQRLGQPVTTGMVSAAVGGLWKFDREFQPLVPFLLREMTERGFRLGGLDGQLGAYQSFYQNDAMPDELTGYLADARATQCRALFRARIGGSKASERQDARAALRGCVAEIDRAVAAWPTLTPVRRAELRTVLATIDRFQVADPADTTAYVAARDRGMYLNFRWFAAQLPPSAKIIVWSHTAHIAKAASFDNVFAKVPNMGSYINRDYGNRAFTLGFTASGGSYRWNRKENCDVPTAPPGSLEAQAMAGNTAGAVFLNRARLNRLGTVPGGLDFYNYVNADWSKALDGVIVFRAEYPPHSTRPGYF